MEPKADEKKYWMTLPGEEAPATMEKEFGPEPFTRRGFLKTLGFGVTSSIVACSQMPVEKIIPFLIQPDGVVPGKAYWYASTCEGCSAQCGILVKNREGRPIKIEGNALSPLNQGGLCAVGQAGVLELYDSGRMHGPLKDGKAVTWEIFDAELMGQLGKVRAAKGRVRVLSHTITSPTLKSEIETFLSSFSDGKHVMYDAVSYSALLDAHDACFKIRAIPHYRFDQADLIVSLGADFLGTWLSPVEFSKQYSQRRNVEGEKPSMARHVQFESRLSLTGANADLRVAVLPSQQGLIASALVSCVAGGAYPKKTPGKYRTHIEATAADLLKNRGKSLVVASSNDVAVQNLVAELNDLLGNYGKTLDMDRPSHQKQGSDTALRALIEEMKQGRVDALIVLGANPIYENAASPGIMEAFKKVPTLVSLSGRLDETARLAHFVAPESHYLESWGDAEPVAGMFHLSQPAISPVFHTRQAGESFSKWRGGAGTYRDALENFWRSHLFSRQSRHATFEEFWRQSVHDGVFESSPAAGEGKKLRFQKNVVADFQAIPPAPSGVEVEVYESVALRDGMQANNPWLQEMPDPISKVTWDNYAAVSVADALKWNVVSGNVLSVEVGGQTLEIPAFIQPGQVDGSIAIALGYGRWSAGKVGDGVGVNAYGIAARNLRQVATVRRTEKNHLFALTQTHSSMEGRPIILETTLSNIRNGKPVQKEEGGETPMLWKEHLPENESWGMAIDLNACTGCSACLIGCQAENNVPVVGREEVYNRREMSWIRIDRYYEGEPSNPSVTFQPMMCQHCGNAPCESVCPVLATTHSSDGLNQQVYNRCVGTRYCANNCPYKVRRFNWFDYAQNPNFNFNMNDDLGRLVLNPDIVVRSRGVMEKCSMCVQRIQEGKIEARKSGGPINSDEIKTACQQSCPTNAILFGDLNDPKSGLSKVLKANPRRYHVLAELNVKPAVTYLAKVRNRS